MVTSLLQEQHEILTRSKRKTKRVRLSDSDGEESGAECTAMEEDKETDPKEAKAVNLKEAEPKLSYQDKLTRAGRTPIEWMDWSDTEGDEDLILKTYENSLPTLETMLGPNVTFTAEEKEAMWKPWRKALIVKPMRKSVGYVALCNRAKPMWRLEGEFQVVDIGNGYFLFRFSKQADYKQVLMEGPWSIGGYCIIVRQWTPYFWADKDTVDKVTTWVRLPYLPVGYYTENGIKKIGEQIGKVLKMDFSTTHVNKGRFARACIEIDLSKPLTGIVYVEGQDHRVEYEGLVVNGWNGFFNQCLHFTFLVVNYLLISSPYCT